MFWNVIQAINLGCNNPEGEFADTDAFFLYSQCLGKHHMLANVTLLKSVLTWQA